MADETSAARDGGGDAVSDSVEHLEKAIEVSKKIARKVDDLLAPLDREMKVMRWPPEYRSILWEAVMLEAKRRWEEAVP